LDRRALISLSDKTGIADFARGLAELGFELISTGGTATTLREAGLPVTEVSSVTGLPEMMDGRVKTLHPKVHAGILAMRSSAEHMRQLAEQGIAPIDLVVVNLYPFAETIAKPDVALADVIENIDIGGPCLLRAAAKNFESVTVVVAPGDYERVLSGLRTEGEVSESTRRRLAAKAYAHTARYDSMIAHWFAAQFAEGFPQSMTLALDKVRDLRYGENSHQRGAVDRFVTEPAGSVATAKHLSGNSPSYNNYQDADGAWQLVREFERPAAAIIKHANPCGCAEADTLRDAMQAAWEADPVSRFGGVIACNRVVDVATAEAFLGPNNKFDVIIAPGYEPSALEMIQQRKGWGATICVLEVQEAGGSGKRQATTALAFRQIDGGMLVQDADTHQLRREDMKVVTKRAPTDDELDDLLFAWKIAKHVKSNAIVIARNHAMLGMGAGQPNRVTSVRLALEQAGEKARGAVLASDAFFPFPDGPEIAAAAGITAIIQPGGSVKDEIVIEAMNAHGVAMVFTGIRHFRH